MFSAKSSGRRTIAARLTAIAVGVSAAALAIPAAAQASPVTVWPNGPVIEVPDLPGLQVPTPPTKPQQQQPKPSTPQQAGVPAMPNVRTSTGWIALAQDSNHTIYWWKDGNFVKSMPISMGSDAHPTPNGTYHTMEKHRSMYMDSSTYGVPIDSPEGYRTFVEYAVRMNNGGIFIHAAPWSVESQGVTNVSHGCINVSTDNGRWVYENIGTGSAIVVKGTVGGGTWKTPRTP
ncbi:MAG: L,D-transpeptidase [Gordonia sp. (in: high G+C Gram-positive bacteria)]|uniref:L,D-transpeptidase n=1 Tax=Gordonia sp. (in: high G+C Gram-positive bacteria) TaxID=84139 RepID=UPI003BB59FC7